MAIKVPQHLTISVAQSIADQSATAERPARSALWEPRGFIAGVKDMAALEATTQAVRQFASSNKMKISLSEAEQLYLLFDPNPGSDATLAGLLSSRPAQR